MLGLDSQIALDSQIGGSGCLGNGVAGGTILATCSQAWRFFNVDNSSKRMRTSLRVRNLVGTDFCEYDELIEREVAPQRHTGGKNTDTFAVLALPAGYM